LIFVHSDLDGHVLQWNIDESTIVANFDDVLPPELGSILSVDSFFVGSRVLLLVQHRGGAIHVVDVETQSVIVSLTTMAMDFVRAVTCQSGTTAASPRLIISSYSDNGSIGAWLVGVSGVVPLCIKEHNNVHGMCMCLSVRLLTAVDEEFTRFLVSAGYENGSVLLFILQVPSPMLDVDMSRPEASNVTFETVASVKAFPEPVFTAVLNPSATRLIAGSAVEDIKVYDVSSLLSSPAVRLIHSTPLQKPGVNDVAWREDGKLYCTAGFDHRIRVFHGSTNAPLAILKGHTNAVAAVKWVRAGNKFVLASGSRDGRIGLWSVYSV
jgi:WD40 repeat protein